MVNLTTLANYDTLKTLLGDGELVLPWLSYDAEIDKLIMVVDNHLMSTYRACPQHFFYAHKDGWRVKAVDVVGKPTSIWALDFGVLVHKAIELHYKNFRTPGYDPVEFLTKILIDLWEEKNMDVHANHKEYILIGGMKGFIGMVLQYALQTSSQNEKLRVLATEVGFGKNREVPLYIGTELEIYLSGRMDLIVDDGYFICPMDHKTMAKRTFTMDPVTTYEIDEGPTGYIYAMRAVLPQILSEGEILKRDCSRIIMNFLCKDPSVGNDRFKRAIIRKSTDQLQDYETRMIQTSQHILDDLINITSCDAPAMRNTQVCKNWFYSKCVYFDVCRQGSREGAQNTLNNGFVQVKLWDTEELSEN